MHRKNPNETARPLTIEFQEMVTFLQDPERVEKEIVRFTDEEGYGKFLDMHLLFEQYLNLKGVKVSFFLNNLFLKANFFKKFFTIYNKIVQKIFLISLKKQN